MSIQRHIAFTITGMAVLAFSAQAGAGRLQKPDSLPTSPWGIGFPIVIHTNQDGPLGATIPAGPWDWIAASDFNMSASGSLLEVIADLQMGAVAAGGEGVSWSSPLTSAQMTAWSSEPPAVIPGAAPVPAPGVLGLLGLAGLASSKRRRR